MLVRVCGRSGQQSLVESLAVAVAVAVAVVVAGDLCGRPCSLGLHSPEAIEAGAGVNGARSEDGCEW